MKRLYELSGRELATAAGRYIIEREKLTGTFRPELTVEMDGYEQRFVVTMHEGEEAEGGAG